MGELDTCQDQMSKNVVVAHAKRNCLIHYLLGFGPYICGEGFCKHRPNPLPDSLGSTIDSTTFGMSQDHDQAGLQLADAKFQAANHAASQMPLKLQI